MSNEPVALTHHPRFVDNAPLIVACLLLVDGLHFVFARLLLPYLPPATSAMYVLGIGTIEVTVFMAIWGRIRFDLFQRYIWFFLAIGFLVATSTTLNYTAVAYIDPGTAALLAQMTILFGLGFGLIWLRERLTALEFIGAFVAIAGVVTISFQPGDYLRVGALIVLASAFMYALHAALVKRYGAAISVAEFFVFRLACTTAFLVLFTVSRRELAWPGWPAWVFLLLAGTVDVAISRGLYYMALNRLRLSLHSIALTLSPVVATLWTLLLFGIIPTFQQLVGGTAVIAGVLMLTMGKLEMRSKK
ncbi:MAG: DMT family transporter [Planctomycetota bacterium]